MLKWQEDIVKQLPEGARANARSKFLQEEAGEIARGTDVRWNLLDTARRVIYAKPGSFSEWLQGYLFAYDE